MLLQTYSGFTLLLTAFTVLNSSCPSQEFDFVQRTEIGALEYQIAVNLVTDRGPSRVLGSQLEPPDPSQTQNLAKEKRTCNVCDQTFAVMYKRAHVKESPSIEKPYLHAMDAIKQVCRRKTPPPQNSTKIGANIYKAPNFK